MCLNLLKSEGATVRLVSVTARLDAAVVFTSLRRGRTRRLMLVSCSVFVFVVYVDPGEGEADGDN